MPDFTVLNASVIQTFCMHNTKHWLDISFQVNLDVILQDISTCRNPLAEVTTASLIS